MARKPQTHRYIYDIHSQTFYRLNKQLPHQYQVYDLHGSPKIIQKHRYPKIVERTFYPVGTTVYSLTEQKQGIVLRVDVNNYKRAYKLDLGQNEYIWTSPKVVKLDY